MDSEALLIVPGYKGSGPGHWQTWLQEQVPGATRVDGIDWDAPVLAHWAGRVRDTLARAARPLRVVAHSFGCLAAVVAAADRPDRVSNLILVAPADPAHFDFTGLRPETTRGNPYTLAAALPKRALGVVGCVIASRNDPWLGFDKAQLLASSWGLDLHDAGNAGHINHESGFGAWPALLDLLEQRPRQSALVLRETARLNKGRGSALAAVRQLTRAQLDSTSPRKFALTKS